MTLNRALQRQILEKLREKYTDPEGLVLCEQEYPGIAHTTADLFINAAYLGEHGLLTHIDGSPANDGSWYVSQFPMRITAKGLDFLEQDGGLSAILGTVTVKLHADTIRELLETKIMGSQLPPDEKRRFVDTLKELPCEALKTVTNKLVEKGLEALSNPQSIVNLVQGVIN